MRQALAGVAVFATALALLAPSGPATAAQAADPPPEVEQLLPAPANGEAAVAALGGDLGKAAALNGQSGPEMAELLRSDATVWVDEGGALFVKDTALPDPAAPATLPERGPYPNSQTFQLHSKPGANRVIYLDFNGHVVTGTQWNASYSFSNTTMPAFSLDGDATTWNQAEHDLIQSVFLRVAEDYAPFDVDVTTQDPGDAALLRSSSSDQQYGTRALITPSTVAANAICGGGCGGVAYLSIYGDVNNTFFQPAFVFSHLLGNDAKNIAEATSHEVGHNIGLNHDGTANEGYYTGHANWAPIMGVGYYEPVVQWSKGEYTGANNTEDDFAVAASNGLPLRADDFGSTVATASPLGSAGSVAGVIERASDVDVFSFSRTCALSTVMKVDVAGTSPNLDARLRLLGSDGVQLASNNPASGQIDTDQASGLSAAITSNLAVGNYFLEVSGVNQGTGATGYTDYGSLGQYTVSVTGCGGGTGLLAQTITAGYDHTCALDTAGKAWCWGVDSSGQVGDGSTSQANKNAPVQVAGNRVYTAISGGGSHTCALDTAGKAWCWGSDANGQVGDGSTSQTSKKAPVAVAGNRVYSAISAGGYHTCALDTAGKAWCWGSDDSGRVGDGSTSQANKFAPVQVSGNRVYTVISAGQFHSCAVDTAGTAWCWGFDGNGQVGDGAAVQGSNYEPVQVAGSQVFAKVSAGGYHTCALNTAGKAWCWGYDGLGQVGDGSTNNADKFAPKAASGTWVYGSIVASIDHTCALDSAGKARCWGYDALGALGNGPTSQATKFASVAVAGGRVYSAIAAGSGHSCAVDTANQAWCWGSDVNGQVGDGSTSQADKYAPVKVAG